MEVGQSGAMLSRMNSSQTSLTAVEVYSAWPTPDLTPTSRSCKFPGPPLICSFCQPFICLFIHLSIIFFYLLLCTQSIHFLMAEMLYYRNSCLEWSRCGLGNWEAVLNLKRTTATDKRQIKNSYLSINFCLSVKSIDQYNTNHDVQVQKTSFFNSVFILCVE